METNVIPEQLTGFTTYDKDNELAGVTDITLPTISYMTEDVQGAGIAGKYSNPIIGQTDSMTITYNWRDITDKFMRLSGNKTAELTSYGSLQMYDAGTNEYHQKQIKIVARGKVKSSNLGSFNTAASNGNSTEVELTYLLLAFDGEKIVEIDKLNYIHFIDGKDWLEETRKNLGK